jgi:transcriptional regulator with XRE-family HTH domain
MPRNEPEPAKVDALLVAVGSRITALRLEAGLLPHQLAERAGMDQNYLWRVEAGRQNLSLRNTARLAKALELTLSQLLDGIEVGDLDLQPRAYAKRPKRGSGPL